MGLSLSKSGMSTPDQALVSLTVQWYLTDVMPTIFERYIF